MRQILENLSTGQIELAEVPCPQVKPGHVLLRTTRSLISPGTERTLLDFGKAGLIEKARQQPDKLRAVLDKVRTDGMIPTLQAVRHKLDRPLPLGYCNVGVVIETGVGVSGFHIGDRVACNGKHAEVVSVPVNLCARVPDELSDEEAAFTVVGAIALQGIRLLQPTMGEAIVVTGLGLIGQLAVRLLRANGCKVLGIDPDPARAELARRAGAETVRLDTGQDPVTAAARFSRGRGVDGVLVTATTRSSEPMRQAPQMCRTRGRIVLVGVTGLELSRDDFYKKEISFQVSCSYGPGRYDPSYEEKAQDYPVGHVRWTEQRNFEAILDLMADRRLDVAPLVSHRWPLDRADAAYEVVAGSEPSLGIVIEYPSPQLKSDAALRSSHTTLSVEQTPRPSTVDPAVAFVGAGNHAAGVLIPAFKRAGARLVTVASASGVAAMHAGRKFGFSAASTESSAAVRDASVDAVVIATRHDSHAALVVQALEAEKPVFVEKPLCLTLDELAAIEVAYSHAKRPLLMVGFNRRFAPHVQQIRSLLAATGPKSLVMTVNAGALARDHWARDRETGGGRIIGEACHFIDLLRYLAGSPIASQGRIGQDAADDTVTLNLTFEDGSIGTVHYFANGSRAFAKERLEVFAGGRVLQLDNFRTLKGFGVRGFHRLALWRQDKGHQACADAFVTAVRSGGLSPIPFAEIVEVSRAAIALA
ncbi:MAG TPA: bi-domain-containing oxidoreductase [Vicinamibacterales bacterium]|nr:bi-domain-containing oxidoreductase [Vicinamibacterales bacterium]